MDNIYIGKRNADYSSHTNLTTMKFNIATYEIIQRLIVPPFIYRW